MAAHGPAPRAQGAPGDQGLAGHGGDPVVGAQGPQAQDGPDGLTAGQRYRCRACGNLTRFDVETSERVRRFWHVDLAGSGVVEEEERFDVRIDRIACRWCGPGSQVEIVAAPAPAATAPRPDGDADPAGPLPA